MLKTALAVAAVLLIPMSVSAQNCSDAIQIYSNNSDGAFAAADANTCTATNAFPTFPGDISSPQPDVVYKFTADSADATITLDTAGSPLIPGLLILDACSDVATIHGNAAGAAGSKISITANGLTDGHEYFLVVTSAPGSPADNCGAFGGSIAGQLPVSLQSFSID